MFRFHVIFKGQDIIRLVISQLLTTTVVNVHRLRQFSISAIIFHTKMICTKLICTKKKILLFG